MGKIYEYISMPCPADSEAGVLADLGENGWELCAVKPVRMDLQPEWNTYYFKREKQAGNEKDV